MLCDGHKGTKTLIDHSLPLTESVCHHCASICERVGWERAQRRGTEDDIHSRANAVEAGAGSERRRRIEDDIHSRAPAVGVRTGSERNGGESETTSAREGTPSGPGPEASATARDRRRRPLASARCRGRDWKRAQRRRIEDDSHSRANAVGAGAGTLIRRSLSTRTYARVSLLNERRRQSPPGLCEKSLILSGRRC